jgi:hypothetical protein
MKSGHDAVDAYREGHAAGQQMVLDLVNRWCLGTVNTVAELIQYIKSLEGEDVQN